MKKIILMFFILVFLFSFFYKSNNKDFLSFVLEEFCEEEGVYYLYSYEDVGETVCAQVKCGGVYIRSISLPKLIKLEKRELEKIREGVFAESFSMQIEDINLNNFIYHFNLKLVEEYSIEDTNVKLFYSKEFVKSNNSYGKSFNIQISTFDDKVKVGYPYIFDGF